MPNTVPTGVPLLISAIALSPSDLLLQWKPPSLELQNGVIRRYVVNVTEVDSRSFQMLYSEDNNITLTSRHPFYQYSYSIAAETIGRGPYSSADVIQMPEAGIYMYNYYLNL